MQVFVDNIDFIKELEWGKLIDVGTSIAQIHVKFLYWKLMWIKCSTLICEYNHSVYHSNIFLCKTCHIRSAIQQMLQALYPLTFLVFSAAFELYYSFGGFYPEILLVFIAVIRLSSRPCWDVNADSGDYICSRGGVAMLLSGTL